MLNKRLFKKVSFLLVLCLIPLLVVGMMLLAREESGILKIVLCSRDNDDVMANEIIDRLMNEDGIILFKRCEDVDSAYESVKNGQADAAWIFKEDLAERIDDYTTSSFLKKSLVSVVERETDISLQLSHEKLYGALFPNVSYSVYKNFILSEIVSYETVDEGMLREKYDPFENGESLLITEKIGGAPVEKSSSYLTLPLRGLLSIVVLLCGMAAVMYHQKDEENGVYDWLSPKKHIIPQYATCFAAVTDTAIAMLTALALSGMFTNVFREIIALLLFAIAAVGFCSVVGAITKKAEITGQLIPFIILACLVLSPIFFNFESMRVLQMLLPTYHYLYAINSSVYLLYLALYSVITFALSYTLKRIIK